MTNTEYVKIYTGNFITIQRIVTELEKINISPVIKDESESGRLAGFGAAIQGLQDVYVSKENQDKAQVIVETITTELQQ